MTPNVTLVVLAAVFYAAGIFLLLERSLTRVLLGVLVLGNATNLLLLSSGGPAGPAPFVGVDVAEMSDPLAQAMILTAIVITLGLAAFVLALIYRSWQLAQQSKAEGIDEGDDEVSDDAEDRRIAQLAAEDEAGTDGEDSDLGGLLAAVEADQETQEQHVAEHGSESVPTPMRDAKRWSP